MVADNDPDVAAAVAYLRNPGGDLNTVVTSGFTGERKARFVGGERVSDVEPGEPDLPVPVEDLAKARAKRARKAAPVDDTPPPAGA